MHAKLLRSRLTLCDPWTVALQAPLSMGLSRQEYWSGCHALLQEVFLTQGSSLHLTSPASTSRFVTTSTAWQAHVGGESLAIYFDLNKTLYLN